MYLFFLDLYLKNSWTWCISVHYTQFSIQKTLCLKFNFIMTVVFFILSDVFWVRRLSCCTVHSHVPIHIINPRWPGPRKKYNPQGVVFFPRPGHLGLIYIIFANSTRPQIIWIWKTKRGKWLINVSNETMANDVSK